MATVLWVKGLKYTPIVRSNSSVSCLLIFKLQKCDIVRRWALCHHKSARWRLSSSRSRRPSMLSRRHAEWPAVDCASVRSKVPVNVSDLVTRVQAGAHHLHGRRRSVTTLTGEEEGVLISGVLSVRDLVWPWTCMEVIHGHWGSLLELPGVGGQPHPQLISTDAHFGVKIGVKFQSMCKISNILASDLQVF